MKLIKSKRITRENYDNVKKGDEFSSISPRATFDRSRFPCCSVHASRSTDKIIDARIIRKRLSAEGPMGRENERETREREKPLSPFLPHLALVGAYTFKVAWTRFFSRCESNNRYF